MVPEHPSQFSPGSGRGESCVTDRKQEHGATGTGCVRPKLDTQVRLQNSYLKPGGCCLLSVSYLKFGFSYSTSLCALTAWEPPALSLLPGERWHERPACLKEARCSQIPPWIQSTVSPFIFLFIWPSQNLLRSNYSLSARS